MGGGAWPFLVGGVICLVNSDNERDLNLLNSYSDPSTQRVKRSQVSLRWLDGCGPLVGSEDTLLRGTIGI